jgi:hypothetical protein
MKLKYKFTDQSRQRIILISAMLASLGLGISLPFLHNPKAFTTNNNNAIKPYKQSTKDTKTVAEKACPVKGKINAKGAKTYHLPGGMFYARTKPTECFKTEIDAQSAGYKRSPK